MTTDASIPVTYVAPGTPEAAGISNETLFPDLSSYFRVTEDDGARQINTAINPINNPGTWVSCPDIVYHRYVGSPDRQTIGSTVMRLANEVMFKDDWIRRYNEIHKKANDAINLIGNRLLQEAEDRQWCSEFDEIIEDVNQHLPAEFRLPARTKDYSVSWTETYTVTVRRTESASEVTSPEFAIEHIRDCSEEMSESDLSWAIRNGDVVGMNWEHDNDDYDVEEL